MKKGILEYKRVWSQQGDFDWQYRPIIILAEGKNSYCIWSWKEPITRLVHKKANHEKVVPR
jgi:hypothetical protein